MQIYINKSIFCGLKVIAVMLGFQLQIKIQGGIYDRNLQYKCRFFADL